jgi:glycosyltransferase involved in cell wall biosynthesis
MIGRIVPIKDTRTFIVAVSLLKQLVPDVIAILIGPEEEDPAYAAGCRSLVVQLGLESTVQFLGRVPDVRNISAEPT